MCAGAVTHVPVAYDCALEFWKEVVVASEQRAPKSSLNVNPIY
ncbi:MAG TPA: hypothetical protein VFB00_04050 [Terriglobales bacterium]|nr:hypothetical protein [Terriglobales bacterium]